MDIRPLDAADPDAMATWHATYLAATTFEAPHATPMLLEELRAEFLGERTGERLEAFSGYADGRLVTTGVVELPLLDNLGCARLQVATHPQARRRGHGSAMLDHLTAVAVAHGRHLLDAEASWGYDESPDGTGTPGADFLTGHGFAFSLGDVQRALELPVDDEVLAGLEADAAAAHRGYRLRHFAGSVPEDLLDGLGALVGSLVTEAPTGELDVEPEVFDATRIRSDERILADSGRVKFTTVALAPGGDVVAYSELVVPAHDPGRVYQWGTLVRTDHRGHRLGMATKAHNLRRVQRHEPGRSVVYTWNAEVNRHMIAVNDALGFRAVGRMGEFQRRL